MLRVKGSRVSAPPLPPTNVVMRGAGMGGVDILFFFVFFFTPPSSRVGAGVLHVAAPHDLHESLQAGMTLRFDSSSGMRGTRAGGGAGEAR